MHVLGKGNIPNRMIFWESAKKFIFQILGIFDSIFWSWNLYKIVILGCRICFFQHISRILATIAVIKSCNIIFQKWGGGAGGGGRAVWNFSKNSSDLVAPPFPYWDPGLAIQSYKEIVKLLQMCWWCSKEYCPTFLNDIYDVRLLVYLKRNLSTTYSLAEKCVAQRHNKVQISKSDIRVL